MITLNYIVDYVLFAISEILPLINVPTNGLLQTLMLGFKDAFTLLQGKTLFGLA
jgi:hypothetical protein